MTVVIAINQGNDVYMDTTNNIAMATGIIAVEQAAQTASLAQLGEMILFTLSGMPSFQSIWVGTPNMGLYQAALVAAIQNIFGVVSVTSIEISTKGDVMSYTAEIETIYGSTVING